MFYKSQPDFIIDLSYLPSLSKEARKDDVTIYKNPKKRKPKKPKVKKSKKPKKKKSKKPQVKKSKKPKMKKSKKPKRGKISKTKNPVSKKPTKCVPHIVPKQPSVDIIVVPNN